MIKVKRIHHVAFAAADCDAPTDLLAPLFGLVATHREHVTAQRTDVVFLHPGERPAAGAAERDDAHAAIEVIAPAGNEALSRFLDRRGPGLHHVCFEVEDLPGALAALKAGGVRLIDEAPRLGAGGHLVAFIHPASTGGVLFELCASPDPSSFASSSSSPSGAQA